MVYQYEDQHIGKNVYLQSFYNTFADGYVKRKLDGIIMYFSMYASMAELKFYQL